ncbi:hypothetical protein F4553_003108 [Allocatelliglobosispora scoriae]|uniref:Regulatory protein n=1 Tax=Allocatelliglobosispora scoriae TaxID=643052 RepID=A0A841BRB0_9ACTN|nr:DUF5685 family protein [Allocatelliglobosispora scoriae]MBB5869729.1 hypothetical protein [Allocatelliglobosispora scoriae]
MFGIIRPCQHSLSASLRDEWLGHLCGMCLSLRDQHGHAARLVTNYDGLLISALVEAQAPAAQRRSAGPCALRGMRGASVAIGGSAQLAAAVSLVLASAKLRDHVDDRDGIYRRKPVAAGANLVARRWAKAARETGVLVGFDTGVLLTAVAEQRSLELAASVGTPLLTLTEPTEIATAAAFAHTAVLAGRPENAEALAEAGRLFGRIAHLVDAAEDLDQDRLTGAWNPLLATGATTLDAGRLARDAMAGIRLALHEVTFTRKALVHALLVHELDHAVTRTFSASDPGYYPPVIQPGKPPRQPRKPGGGSCWWPISEHPPRPNGFFTGCAIGTWMCCTCQVCCRSDWPGPWSGRKRSGPCSDCGDCSGCDCCDCCRCCGKADCDCGPCDC